jgi:phosphoenolpyruvate carboxykinase (ATP)
MITAALNGELNDVTYKNHVVFGIAIPQNVKCSSEILNQKCMG